MDFGTLYQLRNLINRHNVVKDPKGNVNACDDFFRLVVTCHVIAAAFKLLGMTTCDDTHSEQLLSPETWSIPVDERKVIRQTFCQAVVQKFTNFKLYLYGDRIFGYTTEVLSLGLFSIEYCDGG